MRKLIAIAVLPLLAGCILDDNLIITNIRKHKYQAAYQAIQKSTKEEVNHQGRFKDRAIILAAEAGQLKLVKALVEKGADINAQNTFYRGMADGGYSAVMLAAKEGHAEIVDYLIEQGADVNLQTDRQRKRAIQYAVDMEWKIIQSIYNARRERFKDNQRMQWLLKQELIRAQRREKNFSRIINSLIRAGADLNIRNWMTGLTLLDQVILNCDIDLVKFFIKSGAKPEGFSSQAVNAAFSTSGCFRGKHKDDPDANQKAIEIIELLLAEGASVDSCFKKPGVKTDSFYHRPEKLSALGKSRYDGFSTIESYLISKGAREPEKFTILGIKQLKFCDGTITTGGYLDKIKGNE